MKNFYVTSLYKVNDLHIKTYKLYKYLLELSIESVKKHLKGNYEIIILEKNMTNFKDIFIEQHKFLYQLYKKNYPCNILYCGSDVLFNNDCDIFEKIDGFKLFNYTTVKKYPLQYDNILNTYIEECINICNENNLDIKYISNKNNFLQLEHYFNCDIRYYSSNIDIKLIDILDTLMNIWNDKYLCMPHGDQIIYNLILWSQNCNVENALISKYAFQLVNSCLSHNNKFNNIEIYEAQIIHLHLSIFIKTVLYTDENITILNNILKYIKNE